VSLGVVDVDLGRQDRSIWTYRIGVPDGSMSVGAPHGRIGASEGPIAVGFGPSAGAIGPWAVG
jgi:hypothetical protein